MFQFWIIIVGCSAILLGNTGFANAVSLRDAVERAVQTNPAVAAARANRRATEFELKQAQGRALPQLSLDADLGRERIDRPEGFSVDINDVWRTRRQGGLVMRQSLFDGWDRANDVYKSASRVDASALRVLARSEALALDAIESYIDILRHLKVVEISKRNVARHRQILARLKNSSKAARPSEAR